MSDIVSLELLLDEQTEARVRAEWAALARLGLSSLAAHPSPSNRPHITLLVRSSVAQINPEILAQALSLPVPITLGAPLLFGSGDRRVLSRSVVASTELLDLHRSLHRLVGAGDDAPHTRPGEWMPHVTLARRIRLDSLPLALRALDEMVSPVVPGDRAEMAVALRRWDSASATVTELLSSERVSGEPDSS